MSGSDEGSVLVMVVVWLLAMQQAATGCGTNTASRSDMYSVELQLSSLQSEVGRLEDQVRRLESELRYAR